ncbi:AAA family ATPase [Candidatus Woesebacteria bacterium]|nr:AAA family ATPase [Candidatus Woesebacteria bacterium]
MAQTGIQLDKLKERIQTTQVPAELKSKIITRLEQLGQLRESPTFLPEFDRLNKYIDWVVSVPWGKRTEDVLDLNGAKKVLDQNHYDLDEIKERILEYMSVMKIKQQKGQEEEFMRAPIMCFVGLVGTGKTTIASSIAEAMGRKFARIPFGGMGDPLDLRGQSRMHYESEPGDVIKALTQVQSMNPVILLDEIDRVTEQGRSSIMGVLVELLDPEQNSRFTDHYIDYPVNLSEVMFIATANNTHHISTAVLDRLEPIRMPAYSDSEKIAIGKQYMLPKVLEKAGVSAENIEIKDEAWAKVVRPLGYDAGMRTLERTINSIVRKAARVIVEKGPDQKFVIDENNVKDYIVNG